MLKDTLAFAFINHIRELIAQKLYDNGIHFSYARKFCRRPTSEVSASIKAKSLSASIEHAEFVLVYIRSV